MTQSKFRERDRSDRAVEREPIPMIHKTAAANFHPPLRGVACRIAISTCNNIGAARTKAYQ